VEKQHGTVGGGEARETRRRDPRETQAYPDQFCLLFFSFLYFLIAFVYFPFLYFPFLLLSMIHMQEGGKQNEGWACPVVSHVRVTARGCTRPGSSSREGGGGCGEVARGGLRCAGR
jgi:hypothetical protein